MLAGQQKPVSSERDLRDYSENDENGLPGNNLSNLSREVPTGRGGNGWKWQYAELDTLCFPTEGDLSGVLRHPRMPGRCGRGFLGFQEKNNL